MNRTEFQAFCDAFRDSAKKIMDEKNQDYRTGGVNQLHYQDIAKDLDVDPMKVWCVLFMKHVHAVLRYARDGKVASESIISRLHDIHNYAILGAALITELETKKAVKPDFQDLCNCITEACTEVRFDNAIPASVGDPNLLFIDGLESLLEAWLKNPSGSRNPNVADVLNSELATLAWTKPICKMLMQYVVSHDLTTSVKVANIIARLKGE